MYCGSIQLPPGVHMLEVPFPPGVVPPDAMGGSTVSYLVEDDGEWVMIDTGFNGNGCFDSLRRQVDTLGISLADIKRLIVTHCHPDHLGLAGRLKKEANVEVTMHRRDWEMAQYMMRSTEEWSTEEVLDWFRSLGVPESKMAEYGQLLTFGRLLFPTGFAPDILLEDDDTPLGHGQLRAILTPGHTPGHICIYDEERSLLFSGDHVLGKITPHIGPSLLTDADQLGQYLASLQMVQRLDVDLVLPAHEEPFGDLRGRVDELLQHHNQRLEQILAAVRDHPSSVWEIASHVEWARQSCEQMDVTNQLLAVQETLAHLQLLHKRGQVATTERNRLSLYTLN